MQLATDYDVEHARCRSERQGHSVYGVAFRRAPIAFAVFLTGLVMMPGQDQAREVAGTLRWHFTEVKPRLQEFVAPAERPSSFPAISDYLLVPRQLPDSAPAVRANNESPTVAATAQEAPEKRSDLPRAIDQDRIQSISRASPTLWEPGRRPLQALQQTAKLVSRNAFPQWAGVMEKSWAWDVMFDETCGAIVGQSCDLKAWQAFLDEVRGISPHHQLAKVNKRINEVRYREDIDAWSALDYWAAPGEFFANGGDCEDYAIAKYYSLRALGFPSAQMRIVVLRDEARSVPHAVLLVEHAGEALVLDNMSDEILPWSALPAYRPYYSVNEETYRLHDERDLT